MASNRDNFSQRTKDTLAKRVGYICSNPCCKQTTIGPNSDPQQTINKGVAAHICAAAKGGKRYDSQMTPEQRGHINNGIWLCSSCAQMIDRDEEEFTTELLHSWKQEAEDFQDKQLNKKSVIPVDLEPIKKILYPKPENYIPRQLISNENMVEFYYLFTDRTSDIEQIVQSNRLTVLLGDAGSGKSVELQYLASLCCNSHVDLYPVYYRLNGYLDKTIEEIFSSQYQDTKFEHVNTNFNFIFILDGFDEIQEKHRNDFCIRLENFIKANLNVKVVLSSRSNFYRNKNLAGGFSGTVKGFEAYYICVLNADDCRTFLSDQGLTEHQQEHFFKEIHDKKLKELIKLPFYLIEIVKLFKQNTVLPQRTQLMDILIEKKFKFDIEKFRTTTSSLSDIRRVLHLLLQRTGVALEILGRNYMTEDEYQELHEDFEDRRLLNYSGIWCKNNKQEWQFIHNNFGEYLAAKYLSEKPLEEIVALITYRHDNKTVKPNWGNTVAFLASLGHNELLNWLIESNAELLFRLEPDRCSFIDRTAVFKRIFNFYSDRAMWLNIDGVSDRGIVRFAECEETLQFVIENIVPTHNHFGLCNALHLLMHFENLYGKDDVIRTLLCNLIFDDKINHYPRSIAIRAVASLGLFNDTISLNLLERFKEEKDSYMRVALYKYFNKSNKVDQYLNFYINGLAYTHYGNNSEETRLANEESVLLDGLVKVKSLTSFEKLVAYITKDNNSIYDFSQELLKTTINIALRLNEQQPNAVFHACFKMLQLTFTRGRDENKKEVLRFFDGTDTRKKAFFLILQTKGGSVFEAVDIADDACIQEFISRYNCNLIRDGVAISLLHNIYPNSKCYSELKLAIENKTGSLITLPIPYAERESIRKQSKQNLFNALFHKQAFQKLIDELVQRSGNLGLTFKQAQGFTYTFFEHRFDLNDVKWMMYRWVNEKTQKVSQFLEIVDWDLFSYCEIYSTLKHDSQEEIIVSPEQIECIKAYYIKSITEIDFTKSCTYENDEKMRYFPLHIKLTYFMTRFNFPCEEKILLDMLLMTSFHIAKLANKQQDYFDYIEQHVNRSKMRKRIIENLQTLPLKGDVFEKHINYCKKNKITEVLDIAIDVAIDPNRSEWVKRSSIDYLVECMQKSDFYYRIVPNIDDKSLDYIAEKLWSEQNETLQQELKNRANSTQEKETEYKMMAHLIRMNCDDAIEFYVTFLRESKQTSKSDNDENMTVAIASIKDVNKLPYLRQLIDICYGEEFIDNGFHSLNSSLSSAITNIGTQSQEHYCQVRDSLDKTLEDCGENTIKKSFINWTLRDLKESYLKSMEENVTMKMVVKMLA